MPLMISKNVRHLERNINFFRTYEGILVLIRCNIKTEEVV